jgi:hypothetical protein
MFLMLALWTAVLMGAGGAPRDLDMPPWAPSQDEAKLPDGATLPACDLAVQEVASPIGAKIVRRQYSKSSKWGKILRAELEISLGDLSSKFTAMCWGSDSRVQLWFDFMQPPEGD